MSTESTTEGDPIVTSKRQDDGIRVISNVLSHCVINAKDPSNGFNFSKEAANIIINSDGDGNGEANCDGDAYGNFGFFVFLN